MATKKSPLLALGVGLLIVVGLFLNFMQFNKLRAERALLAQETQLVKVMETRLATVKALELQKPQLEADILILGQQMPGVSAEDQLIVDLQSGADLASMEFTQVRFAERVLGKGYMEMPMQMLFSGTYHEILHFLDYLQVYERALRIDELRVDEGKDATGMTVSIKASAFYATE